MRKYLEICSIIWGIPNDVAVLLPKWAVKTVLVYMTVWGSLRLLRYLVTGKMSMWIFPVPNLIPESSDLVLMSPVLIPAPSIEEWLLITFLCLAIAFFSLIGARVRGTRERNSYRQKMGEGNLSQIVIHPSRVWVGLFWGAVTALVLITHYLAYPFPPLF